jgi:hypothetical protein
MGRANGTTGRRIALGVAPHSGWAAVVGIAEAGGRPEVMVRERMEMAGADDAEAKQPYHAVEDLPVAEARKRLARYSAAAESRAHAAIRRIVHRLERDRHRVIGLGILDSSGRTGDSLEVVLASHALIHTADGDHFRDAIAAAASRCGLAVSRVRARDLERDALGAVGSPVEGLHDTVKQLGRSVGPPWGADQKAAALLAWLLLGRVR